MFKTDLIILYVLFFFLGSVFTTIILSHFYEIKAVEEEEKSVTNRGDQTNGLSVIKNLSTKRFFKGIASIVLLILLITFFILAGNYELFKHDKLISYIVLGVFLAYVLFIERTILYTRVPIISMWKKGAPKRAERRQKRKEKRVLKRELEKQEDLKAQEELEEKQEKEGL